MEWLAYHNSHLPRVCLWANLDEYTVEGVKRPLQHLQLGRRYEDIVGIEIRRQVNDCQSKSPRTRLY